MANMAVRIEILNLTDEIVLSRSCETLRRTDDGPKIHSFEWLLQIGRLVESACDVFPTR